MEEKLDRRGLTEAEAIARYRSRNYPKPALTADVIILRETGENKEVLLIRRGGHPYLGKWAFPGGFANANEPVEQTAARELQEETGIEGLPLELVGVYSRPGRDPRGWVVSVAFRSVIENRLQARAGDDADDTGWFTVREDGLERDGQRIPWEKLAFDHGEILRDAIQDL